MSAPPVTTLHQVRSLILDAAAQLKKIDVAASRNYVSALLLLKRSSDVFDEASARVYDRELARTGDDAEAVKAVSDPEEYTDVIFVPPESAWSGLLGVTSQVGNALHEALKGLEKYNSDLAGVLSHIDFNKSLGGTRFRDEALTSLIRRFDEVSLRDADLEFPGLVGDAYESLLATSPASQGSRAATCIGLGCSADGRVGRSGTGSHGLRSLCRVGWPAHPGTPPRCRPSSRPCRVSRAGRAGARRRSVGERATQPGLPRHPGRRRANG